MEVQIHNHIKNRKNVNIEYRVPEVMEMISAEDKDNIIKCAEKYNVSSIILFGSSVVKDKESNDIDIGVKGI